MPTQEEFLASMLEFNTALSRDRVLAHGAQQLRERISQYLHDEARLYNAEAHEAAISRPEQKQQLRLTRSLPAILELHELKGLTESDLSEDKSYTESEDQLVFSPEEVQSCFALVHQAGSGRDSAIDMGDEEAPDYITALAAIIDAGPVDVEPQYQHYPCYPARIEENDQAGVEMVDSEVEETSSPSTHNSDVDSKLELRVSALKVRLISVLDWRLASIDREGLETIIDACEPHVDGLERLVAVVKMQSQHRRKRREALQSKIGQEDDGAALPSDAES